MTRGELRRREKALEAGFIERDGDKAFECVKEIININANEGVLFRFRPPKGYEIDTLESEQIFLVNRRFMRIRVIVKYYLIFEIYANILCSNEELSC